MVKGNKKFKTLNRLEIYLNKVLANPRSPKSDFKILDNAFENVYTDSEDPSENIREMYYDAVSTKKYKDLKFLISDWLSNRVTKETVVATIVIADESNNEKLKIKALKYIHNNIDLIECKRWEELHKYDDLKDEVYRELLVSYFRKNQELSRKVLNINIDLIKTDQYELPTKNDGEEETPSVEESLNEEPPIEESFIDELSIEGTSVEESFIDELSIEGTSVEEWYIGELSIGTPSIEESSNEEPSIDQSIITELLIKELLIRDLLDESINENLSIEEPLIEKQSMKQEVNDDLPSTSSKGLTNPATIAEMSVETEIEEVKSPVNMMNIGELNHSNESEFQSYVAKELSEDDLNRMIVKPSTSCDENNSIENLYTSSNSHFVPIRMARRLFTKKIDVKSIEKHASAGEVEIAVPISPPPVSSNFSMKLPASQGNSSQSLCSNFTEHLMNNCAHNLVTACTICSENVETATNKEEIENVLVDRDLPIEMFIKSKTNKINDPIDILGWVENSVYLTNERKLAMQMFDDLEAKVALTKDMWNEGQPDVLPEQDDSDFFNSKLDKAFNDLITIKSNYPTRQMPVELNQDVVYNSFQDLKQKAERRFEMRHKGIYIPHDYVFDAVPITNNEIFDTPAEAKTDDVSNAKFFPQNKNIKFFKSNQNTFSQRCNNSTGFFPR